MLEKDRHPRFHIGESLLPILAQLGVRDQVAAMGVVKPGAAGAIVDEDATVTTASCTALDVDASLREPARERRLQRAYERELRPGLRVFSSVLVRFNTPAIRYLFTTAILWREGLEYRRPVRGLGSSTAMEQA